MARLTVSDVFDYRFRILDDIGSDGMRKIGGRSFPLAQCFRALALLALFPGHKRKGAHRQKVGGITAADFLLGSGPGRNWFARGGAWSRGLALPMTAPSPSTKTWSSFLPGAAAG